MTKSRASRYGGPSPSFRQGSLMKATAYVHLYIPYHNAGGETTMHDLLRAMVQDGWDVDVILSRAMPGYDEPYEVDGVKVFPFTDNRQLIHAVNGSQVLITHLENSERTAIVGRKYRCPVVQVIHNDMDITKGYVDMGCDLAVFNTEWVKDSFVQNPKFKTPYTIVHPRVDTSRFKFPKGHRKTSQKYITLVNLWAGSPKHKSGKGPEVFYALAEAFPQQKFLGVIGGYGDQDIRNMPNVLIQGHTPNILEDVYAKTKILLMPSHYESFGRVAIEGAALGIPTIASPTPGLKEALGPMGVHADPLSSKDWQIELERLLDPQSYKLESDYAKQVARKWTSVQPNELKDYLSKVRHLGEKTLMLRGW